MPEVLPTHETVYSGPAPEPHPSHVDAPAVDVERVERDVNSFIVHVFGWITGALLISAFCASYSDEFAENFATFDGLSSLLIGQSLWILVGLMMVLAYVASRKAADMPMPVAMATLIAYAGVQGIVFGLLYRGIYGRSLAPVYICMAVLFGLLLTYGLRTGADLTSVQTLLIGAAIAPVLSIVFKVSLDLQLVATCAACTSAWLLLSLVAYHRQFLRELPASFEDDPYWEKAAAVGALQIYLDLVVIVILVIQGRFIRDSITSLSDKEVHSEKIQL